MSPIVIQAIVLILTELLKAAGKNVDWAALKPKAIKAVRAMIPGETRLDDVGAFMAGVLIDLVALYMEQGQTLEDAVKAAERDLPRVLARQAMAKGA